MSAWFMKAKGADDRHGVFVQQLYRDSVAATAGVKLGDEIVRFDGEEVRSANQLATRIGVLPSGAWIELGHRPLLDAGAFGDARFVDIRLAPLDTGSSIDARADTERLASLAERKIATKAMRARIRAESQPNRTVAMTLVGPNGERWSLLRDLQRGSLRIEQGERAIVKSPKLLALAAEDAALAERHVRCNPFLWIGCDLGERLDEAILLGGAHVLGRPAYRFSLAGDGEMEALLFDDGTPAGFVMRDPVRKQKVEMHCRDGNVRVVFDGQTQRGWKLERIAKDENLDESLFGGGQ